MLRIEEADGRLTVEMNLGGGGGELLSSRSSEMADFQGFCAPGHAGRHPALAEFSWRYGRSEFGRIFKVATEVTRNRAQFRHTVCKLTFMMLKSTDFAKFLNVKRLPMSCK